MSERRVCDQDVRDRVTTDLGTTFLLEAGAGTGKTRVLVDRYVTCVLDPVRGTGDVRTVAAITFTEKAAGELRQRVREEFERLAEESAGDAARATVIQGALDALDDAPISTIHGFAGRLLREFPVEAGVDPAFEQLDALGSDLERGRLWEEWLTELAASDPSVGTTRRGLSRLLRAGVRLEWLRTLAVGPRGVFGERYDLDPEPASLPEPDLQASLPALAAALERLASFCSVACSNADDKGCLAAMALVDAGRELADAAAGRRRPARRRLLRPPRQGDAHGSRRRQGQLEPGARRQGRAADAVPRRGRRGAGGARGLRRLPHHARRLGRRRLLALGGPDAARPRPPRLHRPARVPARPAGARPRRARGAAGAVPLPARRRVPGHRPAAGGDRLPPLRARARRPRLAGHGPRARQALRRRRPQAVHLPLPPRGHRHVRPGPAAGRRPARRDRRAGGHPPELPHHAGGGAVGQQRLRRRVRRGPRGGTPAGVPVGRAVPSAGRRPAGLGPARRRLRHRRGSRGRGAAGRGAGAGRAPAGHARRGAGALERAGPRGGRRRATPRRGARRAGATSPCSSARPPASRPTSRRSARPASRTAWTAARPTSRGARSTTRSCACAPSTIRATDPPSTEPCTRRSSGSATTSCSSSGPRGGRFDLFAAQPEAHAAVGAALATLRELHERRAASEPHELAADLVRVARASEFLAATGPGGAQAIANLEKLIDRARAFSGAGGGGLGAFLAWAAEAGDASGEQESQVDDDGDVVHLLTIHKAKGLEYPIVVLVGGALSGGGGGGEPIVDRDERRLAIKLKAELPGAPARDLEPQRYTALREREKRMEASEARRLLYVAATRARDRLVVTCFGRLSNKDGSPAAVLLGPIAGALPSPAPITEEYEDGGLLVLPARVPPRLDEQDGAPDDRGPGRRAPRLARAARRLARSRPAPGAGDEPERPRARRRVGEHRGAGRSGRPSQGAGARLGRPPHHGVVRPRRRVVRRDASPRPSRPSSSARTSPSRRRSWPRPAGARRPCAPPPRQVPEPCTASCRSASSSTASS